MSTPVTMPQAPHKGWLSRNWKWLVPTLVLVFIVLPLGFCGSIFYVAMNAMRHSDVVQEALARARSSPAVVEKLGLPIETGWMISGSINVSGPSGDADISIPISGPKGKATVYVVAKKSAGEWKYERMEAALEGEERRVNLMPQVQEQ